MIIVTLACGHSRSLDVREDIGVGHICYCHLHKTNSLIVSMNAPPHPPRPVLDSMLSCVLQMMQDVQQINNTGDTWENILARAKVRLYDDLDAATGPPRYMTPAPPPVDWEAEYMGLYKHLDAIRAVLGIAPYPDKGLNAGEVYTEVAALVRRCNDLKTFIKPPEGAHWGADWNSVVHKVNSLVKP